MKHLTRTQNRPGSLWDFMNDFERAFDTALTDRTSGAPTMARFNPAVDVDEGDDHYLVSMDLPGVKESDIKVDVHLGQLTISGKRVQETKKENSDGRYFERSFGSFQRSFTLPQEVDSDKIEARFENGVLEVFIPKAEKAQARTIKVENAKGGLFSRLLGEKSKDDNKEH